MITSAEIRKKVQRQWRAFLRSHLTGESILPLVIPARRVTGKALSDNFSVVQQWVETLRRGEKKEQKPGYRIEYRQVNHRQLGVQRLPVQIVIESPVDFLFLTGREKDFAVFREQIQKILDQEQALRDLLTRKPQLVLQYRDAWPRLLQVAAWFRDHPRPGCYIREMDISGVDSKFVEAHRGILTEILNIVLPEDAIDHSVRGLAGHGFERRFGLAWDQPLIRFRLLDPDQALSGLSDLSVPLSEFGAFSPPCSRVFITENKISGLSFPSLADAMVIFGLGYGIQCLQEVKWLREKEIWYWGDIDTHGFAMLSQLRGYFPHVRSLLMDRETLLDHRPLWGQEEEGKRCLRDLDHLTDPEHALYLELREDRLGRAVRLEQERIRFSAVRDALDRILAGLELR